MSKRRSFEGVIFKLRQILENFSTTPNHFLSDEIVRRAFANNAFDGALTLLGILMGSLVLDELHPSTVIKIGLSTSLAIGMSGAFGRFLSEWAERKRAIRLMEKNLFTKLNGTKLEQESFKKTLVISIVDGLSPALAAGVPLIPFFLAQASIISISTCITASFSLIFIVLFGLGVFLGKTCEENVLIYGGVVVAVGFITSLIIFLFSFYFN